MIFGIHYLCGSLYFTQDTILLSWWKGDHDVGLYQSVFKIILIFLILPDIAINALLPTLSRLNVGDEDRWMRTGALVQKILALVAFPLAGVIFVYPEQILSLVYGGTAFAEATPVLRIFSIILLIRFVVETPALMLTTSRRQVVRMVIVVGAVVLNAVANSFAVPRYGIEGAALVSLGTNVIVGAGYVMTTRPFLRQWGTDIRILLPAVVMTLCTIALWQIRTMSMWYSLPVLAMVYGGVLYFFGFTREERRLVFTVGPLRPPIRHSA
jgi:O-antigen/teichoic acid export membrane protein